MSRSLLSAVHKLSASVVLAPVLLLTTQVVALAASFTIPINTGITNKPGLVSGDIDPSWTWNYTGSVSDPRYNAYTDALNPEGTWIMAGGNTGSNTAYGPDVPGGVAPFSGVSFLFSNFLLPANATNVRFNVDLIAADDRVVLSLNNQELGAFALPRSAAPTPPWSGVMTDGAGTDVPRSFTPNVNFAGFSFDDPSLFVTGGMNVVRLWVNNIGARPLTASAIPSSDIDRTSSFLRASVSYDTPDPESTPEPAAMLGLASLVALGLRRQSRRIM